MKKLNYPPLFYTEKAAALLKAIWALLIWLTFVLMASRYAMFRAFVDPAQLAGHEDDMWRMWLTGLRYDARVSAFLLLPSLGLGLLLGAGDAAWRFFLILSRPLFALAAFIAAFFAIANYYYYQTYHNFIDIFVFGFGGEDQAAVLSNIWQDYPVIEIGVALLLLTLLPAWLGGRILHAPFLSNNLKGGYRLRGLGQPLRAPSLGFLLYLLFSIALFILIARGSLGTFPLGRNSAQISTLNVLNKLAPNGLITFYWASRDYRLETSFAPVSPEDGQKLLKEAGLPALTETTPANPWLRANPPHVVVAMLESFGSNMLALDQPPQNDLLGSLRRHFAADFLFRRFLPEGNGTAPSLAAVFFLSPAQNISHSVAQNTPLSHTPFRAYREAGYRTVFIYPGNMMWRNLADYLPLQGVDRFYDQNDLMKLYPEAAKELGTWGVPDEYAYRLIEQLLRESDRPLFIGLLTTTNHPPYHVPSAYKPAPISQTPSATAHFLDDSAENLRMLETFQYTADSLGRFLDNLKASDLGRKTLVAATGDHQMRRLQTGPAGEEALNLGVPFYLYVPQDILAHTTWARDPGRPGSHKDILPTLYAFSLPATKYLALGGRNLLARQDDQSRAFGYNERMWITSQGAFFIDKPELLRPWADNSSLLLKTDSLPGPDPSLPTKIRAYPELLRWQLNARVSEQNLF